jgi:hypothetical protein
MVNNTRGPTLFTNELEKSLDTPLYLLHNWGGYTKKVQ